MKRAPTIWGLLGLIRHCEENHCAGEQTCGVYVPARPLAFDSWGRRLYAAWLAFTGRADVVIWPGGQ